MTTHEDAVPSALGDSPLDALACIATRALTDILQDPETSPAIKLRAASTVLRYVTAERNRERARPKPAAAPDRQHAPPPDDAHPGLDERDARADELGPRDAIDLRPLTPEHRAIMLECRRQLLEYGIPDADQDADTS